MASRKPSLDDRFATAFYPQTMGGIYVCGINWGGRDDDEMAALVRERRSFFSDAATGSYPYKARILKWFEAWGVKLATSGEEAGDLEHSISQTNWLAERSLRSEHRAEAKYLLAHAEELVEVVEARDPRVIFFFGSCLGSALERGLKAHHPQLEKCFGELATPVKILSRDLPSEPKFNVRFFEFERCRVLCFPHPTGAKGITNMQIARYAHEVREALFQSPVMMEPRRDLQT